MELKHLRPEDLSDLSDLVFRQVVNADLRHRVHPVLSEETRRALREPENMRRWRATLLGILRSADSQRTARDDDFAANRLARIREAEADPARATEIRRELEIEEEEYRRWRATNERFISGVREYLAIADGVCADTDLARDRDRLRERVTDLEAAILDHRRRLLAELDAGDQPDEADEDLWRLVAER
jgi:hypothetical protein